MPCAAASAGRYEHPGSSGRECSGARVMSLLCPGTDSFRHCHLGLASGGVAGLVAGLVRDRVHAPRAAVRALGAQPAGRVRRAGVPSLDVAGDVLAAGVGVGLAARDRLKREPSRSGRRVIDLHIHRHDGELFGLDGVSAALGGLRRPSPTEAVAVLRSCVADFAYGTLTDDLCLLAARMT